MGMIMSFSEALERVRFTKLRKGRVHKADLVVLLDRPHDTGPDWALVKLANGEWTVLGARHTPNGNWACMDYGLDHLDKSVLDALVKAGALDPETRAEHERRVLASKDCRDKKYARESLKRACATLGIPIPAEATTE